MSSKKYSLKLHDTMKREVCEVSPLEEGSYRFYCCGPTVYGYAHIGNFRTFVIQDVFRRVLELTGQSTVHVRNITDVDDKTIRVSGEEGKTLKEFTEYWCDLFHKDGEALNMLTPHHEPSAVDHVPEQIELIEKLIEKGNAYSSPDGSVYFNVGSHDHYGCLSRLKERELKTGSSVSRNSDDEYEKESLADFALWKGYKDEDGENFWESPWGKGRPGWHLECSAMSHKYLGASFDLHSGGVDLIFPHHENEIAQSEAGHGGSFANHWFHITHLLVDGGKMSKSLGNLYTLDDIKEKGFSAMALRYVLIMGHYRQSLNFTLDSLKAATQALEKFAKFESALVDFCGMNNELSYEEMAKTSLADLGELSPAWDALLNDLNVPDALGKIFTVVKSVDKKLRNNEMDQAAASATLKGFRFIMLALGLVLEKADDDENLDIPEEVKQWAEARWVAKQSKEWGAADDLRNKLTAAGWQIKDKADGYDLLKA